MTIFASCIMIMNKLNEKVDTNHVRIIQIQLFYFDLFGRTIQKHLNYFMTCIQRQYLTTAIAWFTFHVKTENNCFAFQKLEHSMWFTLTKVEILYYFFNASIVFNTICSIRLFSELQRNIFVIKSIWLWHINHLCKISLMFC